MMLANFAICSKKTLSRKKYINNIINIFAITLKTKVRKLFLHSQSIFLQHSLFSSLLAPCENLLKKLNTIFNKILLLFIRQKRELWLLPLLLSYGSQSTPSQQKKNPFYFYFNRFFATKLLW